MALLDRAIRNSPHHTCPDLDQDPPGPDEVWLQSQEWGSSVPITGAENMTVPELMEVQRQFAEAAAWTAALIWQLCMKE
jgi:hypothetical protein